MKYSFKWFQSDIFILALMMIPVHTLQHQVTYSYNRHDQPIEGGQVALSAFHHKAICSKSGQMGTLADFRSPMGSERPRCWLGSIVLRLFFYKGIGRQSFNSTVIGEVIKRHADVRPS